MCLYWHTSVNFFMGFAYLYPRIELHIVAKNKHERTASSMVDIAMHLKRPVKIHLMYRKVCAIYNSICAKNSTWPRKWVWLDKSKDNGLKMELAKHISSTTLGCGLTRLTALKVQSSKRISGTEHWCSASRASRMKIYKSQWSLYL